MIGIFLWTEKLANTRIAAIAVCLMAIMPLFIHFQTVAMMESLVLLTTTWTFWCLTSYQQQHSVRYLIGLGFIIGIGGWIKTNTLIPSGLAIISLFYLIIRERPVRFMSLVRLFIPIGVAFITLAPIVFQPDVSKILTDAGTFTLSWEEILHVPWQIWIPNSLHVLYSVSVYMGPVVLIALSVWICRPRSSRYSLLIFWTLGLIMFPVLVNRHIQTRYYLSGSIPLLPLLALIIHKISISPLNIFRLAGGVTLLTTAMSSLLLIIYAPWFFGLFPKYAGLGSEHSYGFSWTSGYATRDAVTFLTKQKKRLNTPALLAVPDFQGNPTDYVIATFGENTDYLITLLDTASDMEKFRSLKGKLPIYYLTRHSIVRPDLAPFLSLIQAFPTPDRIDAIEIFSVKPNEI
jgi:hypothetical protein